MQTKMRRSSWVKCGKVDTHCLHKDIKSGMEREIQDMQDELYGRPKRKRAAIKSKSITEQDALIRETKERLEALDLAVQASRARIKAAKA